MNERLDSCKEEHDHDVFDERYIPARLIDVSSEIPCLKVRENIPLSASSGGLKYAALSYCWGSGTQVKTTADTLQSRKAGISEIEMPQVLRDAIRVTRALGISFLWMDALCILQDDQSDWEKQCAEMHKIYGSAHVTLCVANSGSCNEAFLQQTAPFIRQPFQSIRAPDMKGSFLVQCNEHVPGDRDDESHQLLYADFFNSHWSRRGWIFQETRLSTRKLIFGRCNPYFLCDHTYQARGKCAVSARWLMHIDKGLFQRTPKDIYEAWNEEVLNSYSEYDASLFSYDSDVLPALSGLATLFGKRLKDFYYAGHWKRDLYRSLAWSGNRWKSQPFVPAGLIIPSWSPLAKGYSESYQYILRSAVDLRSEIRVPRVQILTVGENPFGTLKECRLWIRGYVLNISCMKVQLSPDPSSGRDPRQWHLVVQRHCFGHLQFDWQAGLDDPWKRDPSVEDVKQLKLLLLGSFQDHTSEEVPEDEGSERSSVRNYQDWESAPSDNAGEENEILDHSEESCEGSCSQGPASYEDTSTAGDGGRGDHRCQIPIRRGYGLIISPTGNDGEFRRVGAVFSRPSSRKCTPHGDGDLKALQSLAQMETVQLV